MQTLTRKEEENLFLDVWYKNFQDSFDYLWFEGIEGDLLINDFAKFYPQLYRRTLYLMEEEAQREGVLLK